MNVQPDNPILAFFIDCPRSGNSSLRTHWAARKRQRRALYLAVLVAVQKDPRWRAAVLHPTLDADRRRRRVVFTRGVGVAPNKSGKGKHPTHVLDADNFRGALKSLTDVLLMDKPRRPGLGFLVDDSSTWLDDEYVQDASGAVAPGRLLVEVFEVTP